MCKYRTKILHAGETTVLKYIWQTEDHKHLGGLYLYALHYGWHICTMESIIATQELSFENEKLVSDITTMQSVEIMNKNGK